MASIQLFRFIFGGDIFYVFRSLQKNWIFCLRNLNEKIKLKETGKLDKNQSNPYDIFCRCEEHISRIIYFWENLWHRHIQERIDYCSEACFPDNIPGTLRRKRNEFHSLGKRFPLKKKALAEIVYNISDGLSIRDFFLDYSLIFIDFID